MSRRSVDDDPLTPRSAQGEGDNNAFVIRLLRVFLGAAVRDDDDDGGTTPDLPSHHSSSRTSCGRRVQCAPSSLPPTAAAPTTVASEQAEEVQPAQNITKCEESPGPTAQQGATKGKTDIAAAAAEASATVDAREQAGCTLWDMSADERHASAMCSAGLVAVSCAVLGYCAGAAATAQLRALAVAKEEPDGSAVTKLPVILVTAAEPAEAPKAPDTALSAPSGGQEVERLREIACGLLANACSHRSLR